MGNRKGNQLSTITSSELSSVIYSPLGETIKNPFSREIFLIRVRVAGIRYRENIGELLNGLKVGDKVLLIREPENCYDERAIMIRNEENQKLGYVPRDNNGILSNMMDAGLKLSGKVFELKDPVNGEYPWNALFADIFLGENSSGRLSASETQQENLGDGFFSKLSGLLQTDFSGGMNRPFSRKIFLTNIPAARSFYIENLQRVLCRMRVGDRVLLRREMGDENDEASIVVLNKRQRKLGYIPGSHSPILARLMDAGKHIYGVADKIDYEKDGVGGLNRIIINVFMED